MSKKEVQIQQRSPNWTCTYIVSQIEQGKSPYDPKFLKELNFSKSRMSYHIKRLKENGQIKKISYGVWKTTKKKSKQVQKSTRVGYAPTRRKILKKKVVRGHGFRVSFKIRKLKNWDRRADFLLKNNIPFKVVSSGFGYYHSLVIDDWRVWLCRDSVVFFSPKGYSAFEESADMSCRLFLKDLFNRMNRLERLLGVGKRGFKVNGEYVFRIYGSHYALIKNGLAKLYKKNKQGLQVRDKKGELWLIIDDSFNLEELETVAKNDQSRLDNKLVKRFFNDLKEFPITNEDITKAFVRQNLANDEFKDYIQSFAKHLATHTEVMLKIKEFLDKK